MATWLQQSTILFSTRQLLLLYKIICRRISDVTLHLHGCRYPQLRGGSLSTGPSSRGCLWVHQQPRPLPLHWANEYSKSSSSAIKQGVNSGWKEACGTKTVISFESLPGLSSVELFGTSTSPDTILLRLFRRGSFIRRYFISNKILSFLYSTSISSDWFWRTFRAATLLRMLTGNSFHQL